MKPNRGAQPAGRRLTPEQLWQFIRFQHSVRGVKQLTVRAKTKAKAGTLGPKFYDAISATAQQKKQSNVPLDGDNKHKPIPKDVLHDGEQADKLVWFSDHNLTNSEQIVNNTSRIVIAIVESADAHDEKVSVQLLKRNENAAFEPSSVFASIATAEIASFNDIVVTKIDGGWRIDQRPLQMPWLPSISQTLTKRRVSMLPPIPSATTSRKYSGVRNEQEEHQRGSEITKPVVQRAKPQKKVS
jgi:hypothetical protein